MLTFASSEPCVSQRTPAAGHMASSAGFTGSASTSKHPPAQIEPDARPFGNNASNHWARKAFMEAVV